MKITLSVIKADIGSVGGHIRPSLALLERVRKEVRSHQGKLLIDSHVSATGDDIAILMTHREGLGAKAIHRLVWNAFINGTELARKQGLCGAGHDHRFEDRRKVRAAG